MDDEDANVKERVQDLVASYKLLEDDAARGLGSVKDRLNQSILEQWIDLATSGNLTEEHVELIRSSCTLSFGARKRAKKATDKLTPSLDALGTPRKKKRSVRQQNDDDDDEAPQNNNEEEEEEEGDGNGDDDDDDDDDGINDEAQELAASIAAASQAQQAKMLAAANRKAMLITAKNRLMQHQVSWRRHVRNEDGIKYDTRYLLEKLPSIMSQTEDAMDFAFADEDQFAHYHILDMIKQVIKLHKLGTDASLAFHEVGEKQWRPVVFSSLGGLALDLEDQISTAAVESETYQHAWKAVEYAKDSQIFNHPKGYSIHDLAKFFLTINVGTRNYLLMSVHCAAGCAAFDKLSLSKLTERRRDGRDPILSPDDMVLLGYGYDDYEPRDTDDLLKSFKLRFDDESVSYDDKTKLMLAFLRIKKHALDKLKDRYWAEIDRLNDDGGMTESSKGFFDSQNTGANERRRSNALMALTMLTCSTYIRDHTSADMVDGGVEYNPNCDGVASLLYRNSINFLNVCGMTKLMMPKVYDGSASDKYMVGLYDGMDEVIKKAAASSYSKDIPVLFDLDTTESEIDQMLVLVGYVISKEGGNGSDGNGDDADSDKSLEW